MGPEVPWALSSYSTPKVEAISAVGGVKVSCYLIIFFKSDTEPSDMEP